MKKKVRQRRCKNCQKLYKPDPRHLKRQKFCRKPACKAASKKYSQQKWLDKPENQDHFSGPEHVVRVQEWRKRNPGYWKRKKRLKEPCLIVDALQEMKSVDDTTKALNLNVNWRDIVPTKYQAIIPMPDRGRPGSSHYQA